MKKNLLKKIHQNLLHANKKKKNIYNMQHLQQWLSLLVPHY